MLYSVVSIGTAAETIVVVRLGQWGDFINNANNATQLPSTICYGRRLLLIELLCSSEYLLVVVTVVVWNSGDRNNNDVCGACFISTYKINYM